MLAKLTAKNQLTLPKAALDAVEATEYFEVEARGGQLVLTPVRLQRADAVRAKLADLGITPGDVADAVAWSRTALPQPALGVAEPKPAAAVPAARKAPRSGRKPRT